MRVPPQLILQPVNPVESSPYTVRFMMTAGKEDDTESDSDDVEMMEKTSPVVESVNTEEPTLNDTELDSGDVEMIEKTSPVVEAVNTEEPTLNDTESDSDDEQPGGYGSGCVCQQGRLRGFHSVENTNNKTEVGREYTRTDEVEKRRSDFENAENDADQIEDERECARTNERKRRRNTFDEICDAEDSIEAERESARMDARKRRRLDFEYAEDAADKLENERESIRRTNRIAYAKANADNETARRALQDKQYALKLCMDISDASRQLVRAQEQQRTHSLDKEDARATTDANQRARTQAGLYDDVCDKKATESNASRQLARAHSGDTPYVCEPYSRSFSRSDNLASNMMTTPRDSLYSESEHDIFKDGLPVDNDALLVDKDAPPVDNDALPVDTNTICGANRIGWIEGVHSEAYTQPVPELRDYADPPSHRPSRACAGLRSYQDDDSDDAFVLTPSL